MRTHSVNPQGLFPLPPQPSEEVEGGCPFSNCPGTGTFYELRSVNEPVPFSPSQFSCSVHEPVPLRVHRIFTTMRYPGGMAGIVFLFLIEMLFSPSSLARQYEGIWNVSGRDGTWGTYKGKVELRRTGSGYRYLRVIAYTNATYNDFSLAAVWEGEAKEVSEGTLRITVRLNRLGFIKQLGALERTAEHRVPLQVRGVFTAHNGETCSGTFVSLNSPEIEISETMTYEGPPGPEPIFRQNRKSLPSHSRPPFPVRALLKYIFRDFYRLPFVSGYISRPDFRRGIHYFVYDRTDYEFYQRNPDRLRVINKVIDAISLAETEQRANAFRYRLAEKAALFQADVEARHLDPTGMVANSIRGSHPPRYIPDGDAALWTGCYIASQSYRYRLTGDPEALENIIVSLKALFALVDITGDPATFARTLRIAPGEVSGKWRRGTGKFAGIDWLAGGNNDMLEGLHYGFLTAYEALPDDPRYDELRAGIRRRVVSLVRYSKVANDGRLNEVTINWLAYYLTGEEEFRNRYRQLLNSPLLRFYVARGYSVFHYWGISGWSGLHLSAVSQTTLTTLARRTNDPRLSTFQRGLRKGWQRIRRTRQPLWTFAAMGLGELSREKYSPYLEDAVWSLRELPFPKTSYHIDWSLNPDWSLSPYPELPWKFDWKKNPGRQQGLYAYPLFERVMDKYVWKSNPFRFRGGGGNSDEPGVDFLHAYWLGRFFDLIP